MSYAPEYVRCLLGFRQWFCEHTARNQYYEDYREMRYAAVPYLAHYLYCLHYHILGSTCIAEEMVIRYFSLYTDA